MIIIKNKQKFKKNNKIKKILLKNIIAIVKKVNA